MNRFVILPQAILAAALCLCSAAPHAEGRDGRVPTPAELALLPPYCKDAQIIRKVNEGRAVQRDEPIAQHWFGVLGESFWDIHHYCFALTNMNRAERTGNAQEKQTLLRTALPEFDYVLQRAPADMILLPEIHLNKGKVLLRMGQDGAGVAEFEKAIELKPDYWPPYAHLSDYYKDEKNPAKARQILEQGLKANPGSEPLLRREKALKN